MIPAKVVIAQAEYWLSQVVQAADSRRVYEIAGKLRQEVDTLCQYRYGSEEWKQDVADELKTQIIRETRDLLRVLAEYDSQALDFCERHKYLCEQAEKLRGRGLQEGRYYLCYAADWVLAQAEQLYISRGLLSEVQGLLDACGQMGG